MHHYITKYTDEDGKLNVTSWFQLDLFGKCYTFSIKSIKIGDK